MEAVDDLELERERDREGGRVGRVCFIGKNEEERQS
jgi:hypothetical protein